MKPSIALASGVVVEPVGDEALVIVPGQTDVIRLTGPTAQAVIDICGGAPVSVSDSLLSHLVDLGIVTVPGLSRRGLIKAGALGAGAGIAVLAMPTVASASSPAEVETQLISFTISSNTSGLGAWPLNTPVTLSHGGPPWAKNPSPFPTPGTLGVWAVKGFELSMRYDGGGNLEWSTVDPPAGPVRAALENIEQELPAERGTLTWTFEGVTFSGPDTALFIP